MSIKVDFLAKCLRKSTFMFIFAEILKTIERNLLIELLEDGEKVSLYSLNIQSKILILGNGGLKRTSTYEEDENLHRQVRTLQKIDIELKQREKSKVIVVKGTELLGELSFTIDDE